MPPLPSSSAQAARKALADRLKAIMRDAGLTGRELAARCGWHPSKTSRILNAISPPDEEDIRRMPTYAKTKRFRIYVSNVVPGILQTPGYATAILRMITEFQGTPDDVEQAVVARTARSRLLREGNHRFRWPPHAPRSGRWKASTCSTTPRSRSRR